MKRFLTFFKSRFIRFLAVGALNTAFGYGVFALLTTLGLHYAIAALCSTIAGIIFNFKTIGVLVFGSHENLLIFRFFLVYAFVYGANVLGLALLSRVGVGALVAGAILALPLACVSFMLNKIFVFGRTKSEKGAGGQLRTFGEKKRGPNKL